MDKTNAVLLLFLLLNLTACTTSKGLESWHRLPSPPSVAEHIEAEQPERVRVTMRDGLQLDIEEPFVSGDQLLGRDWRTLWVNRLIGNADDVSVPLADILQLEVRRPLLNPLITGAGAVVLVGALGFLFIMGIGGGFGS